MNIFNKLFRRQNAMDIISIMPTDTQYNAESRLEYYEHMLSNAVLKPITKEEQFQKLVEEIPEGKVLTFFNLQLINIVEEKSFVALDDYIHSAKEKPMEEAFYRGVRHGGPGIIYAFTKDCIPEAFDGSSFSGCLTVAMYL